MMPIHDSEFYARRHQRGGTVSVWVALLLIGLSLGEMAVIRHLLAHRNIEITFPSQPYKSTGIVPRHAYTCGSFGAICYLKI
jgi:hypothetical protein